MLCKEFESRFVGFLNTVSPLLDGGFGESGYFGAFGQKCLSWGGFLTLCGVEFPESYFLHDCLVGGGRPDCRPPGLLNCYVVILFLVDSATALDEGSGGARVFKLLTYCHAFSGSCQHREELVEQVVME